MGRRESNQTKSLSYHLSFKSFVLSIFEWPFKTGFTVNTFMFTMFVLFQGKYVEIQFSRGGEPDGGKISNFLLEKVFQ